MSDHGFDEVRRESALRGEPVGHRRHFRSVLSDYVAISKPRIILLLLVVAWAALFVAAGGVPAWKPFALVTAAGILSTASSGAFNNVYERDRDAQMGRTADRPVASGRITPTAATLYATAAGLASFLILYLPGYTLAAWLDLGAIGFYVIVYTMLLKPNTVQNIVIGGFAGSFPALIGWAAATGTLGAPAWILAAMVFLWTPPHFWALALLYKDDYEAADYPMMPVIHGERSTKVQMLLYAVATVVVSLALVPMGYAGYLYAVAALVLGALFVGGILRVWSNEVDRARYRSYFLYTIQYLGFLLLLLMADQALIDAVPGAKPF